jgi:lipopolysaccharide/colanic/teichoic acid biosynthesis glycosyltransferase
MNPRRLSYAVLLADLAWAAVAMGTAIVLRYGTQWSRFDRDSSWHLMPFLAATWLIWALMSLVLSLDGFRGGWRLSAVVSQLLLAVGGVMLVLLSGGYLARSYVSRLALVEFSLLLFVGFAVIRVAAYLFLRERSRNGFAQRVVIVGRGHLARELARKIQRHPEMLCKVVGFFAPDESGTDSQSIEANSEPAIKTTTLGVVDILSAQQTDQVILVLDECASPDLLNLAALCRHRGIKVSIVPQFYELYLSRPDLMDLGGIPVLQLARPGLSPPALIGKRMLDLVLGTVLSLAAIPVLVPLAIAIRCSKGKAFCWETRFGLQGKSFAMLRLNIDRTADNRSGFEGVLRELSLTELPQLWNVLRGEMSLVGPRPESRDRVCRYSEWQRQRLTVKPGMTGLAQVQGLRDQHSSEDKTRFDLQYLLNCSLWTDLSLLLQTVWTLARRSVGQRYPVGDQQPPKGTDPAVVTQLQRDILENAHRP